jgi:TctA family transporter
MVYGDWSVFVTRPICIAMLAVTAAFLLYPLYEAIRDLRSKSRSAVSETF